MAREVVSQIVPAPASAKKYKENLPGWQKAAGGQDYTKNNEAYTRARKIYLEDRVREENLLHTYDDGIESLSQTYSSLMEKISYGADNSASKQFSSQWKALEEQNRVLQEYFSYFKADEDAGNGVTYGQIQKKLQDQAAEAQREYDTIVEREKYYGNWKDQAAFEEEQRKKENNKRLLMLNTEKEDASVNELQALYDEVVEMRAHPQRDQYNTGLQAYREKMRQQGKDLNNPYDLRKSYDEYLRKQTDEAATSRLKEAGYNSLEELDSEIKRRNEDIRQARMLQQANTLFEYTEAARNDPAFYNYVSAGRDSAKAKRTERAKQADTWWAKVLAPVGNYNPSPAALPSYTFADIEKEYPGTLTEEEKQVLYYYQAKAAAGQISEEKLQEYMEALSEERTNRGVQDFYDDILKESAGLKYLYGAHAGIDQYFSGLAAWGDKDGYVAPSRAARTSELAREGIIEQHGGVGKTVYDLITTTANMLPSIALGAAADFVLPGSGAWVNAASVGASAGGQAYAEMVNSGYTEKESRLYGMAVGSLEAGLEKILNGAGNFAKGVLTERGVKTLTQLAQGRINNAMLRWAVTNGIQMGGNAISNGVEEGLQDVLSPFVKMMLTGDWDGVDWGEVGYSAMLGALSAVPFNIEENAANAAKRKAVVLEAIENGDIDTLIELGRQYDADSMTAQFVNRVDTETPINMRDVRNLSRALGTAQPELQGQVERRVRDAIKREGVTGEAENVMAELAMRQIGGEKLSDSDISRLDALDIGTGEKDARRIFGRVLNKAADIRGDVAGVLNAFNAAVNGDTEKRGVDFAQRKANSQRSERMFGIDVTQQGTRIDKENGVFPKKIVSFENGKMQLELTDGRTVDADSVQYANTDEALLYEGVRMLKTDPKTANAIIQTGTVWAIHNQTSVPAQVRDLQRAYRAGLYGDTTATPKAIPTDEWSKIYEMGRRNADTTAAGYEAGRKAYLTEDAREIAQAQSERDAAKQRLAEDREKAEARRKAAMDLPNTAKEQRLARERKTLQDIQNDIRYLEELQEKKELTAEDKKDLQNLKIEEKKQLNRIENLEKQIARAKERWAKHEIKPNRNTETAAEAKAERPATEIADATTKGILRHVHYIGGAKNAVQSGRQSVSVKALGVVTRAITNNEVYIYESVMKNGVRVFANDIPGFDEMRAGMPSPNGFFDPKTGAIYIDLNAGENGQGSILWTAGHELTHYLKEWNADSYDTLKEFLTEAYGESGVDTEILIQRQIDKAARAGIELTHDQAEEEMVADAMQTMFTDADLLNRVLELKARDKGLVEKIHSWLQRVAAKISAHILREYGGLRHDATEARKLKTMVDALNHAADIFAEGLVQAGENFAAARGEDGITESGDGNSTILTSARTVLDPKGRETAKNRLLARFPEMTEADVDAWLDAETSLSSIILQPDRVAYLDYTPGEGETAIKKNSDYPQGTMDFSNICPKRRRVSEIMSQVFKKFPNQIFQPEDLSRILNIMKEHGLVTPCMICYVEDRRQRDSIVADLFVRSLDAYRRGDRSLDGVKEFNAGQMKAFQMTGTDGYTPEIGELVTQDGMLKLGQEHPDVLKAWKRFNNARGMAAVRLLLPEAEYAREIRKYSKRTVTSKNNKGGLRFYSFSDFEIIHLLDIVQALTDCAEVGLYAQGYTKVNEYVQLVKDTGLKLNRSLIPKGELGYHIDKSGKVILDFDFVEGIDASDKNFFSDYAENPNIGNIVIGVNYDQIRAAMLDSRIDQIIPFHTGQSEAVLKIKGIDAWTNYKDSQTDKTLVTDADGTQHKATAERQINIYTDVIAKLEREGVEITKRSFVEKYLDVCRELGYLPRFSEFLNRNANGNYVYTEGYHKLLVDFKTFSQDEAGTYLPQGQITPAFDVEYATQLLKDHSDQRLMEDSDFHKQLPGIVDEITEQVVQPRNKNGGAQPQVKQSARVQSYDPSNFRDREGKILRLEQDIDELRDEINDPFFDLGESVIRQKKADLNKLLSELENLEKEERREAVKTSYADILKNIDRYRFIDLRSLLFQMYPETDDVDFEELDIDDIKDAIRSKIEDVRTEWTEEGDAKSFSDSRYGLYVRPIPQGKTVSIDETKGDIRYSLSEFDSSDAMQEYTGGVKNSLRVTDRDEIARLEAEPKLKLYRSLVEINGKLYSPMSTFDANGKLRNPYEFNQWYRSVEDPDHAYPVTLKSGKVKYKFDLFKGGQDESFKKGDSLPAVDYNPYEHQTDSMFNDQFSGAYKRPNLVLVEFEVPASEETIKYRAPKAALTTGWNSWHAGPVAAKIKKAGGPERKLFLSRWVKPVGIVPIETVAQNYKENLAIAGIAMPDNLVPPNLLKALIDIGVPIEKSGKVVYNDEGMPIGWREGKKVVPNGIDYTDDSGYASTVRTSLRDQGAVSDRELLSGALMEAAQTEDERARLKRYQADIDVMTEMQERLDTINSKLRELSAIKDKDARAAAAKEAYGLTEIVPPKSAVAETLRQHSMTQNEEIAEHAEEIRDALVDLVAGKKSYSDFFYTVQKAVDREVKNAGHYEAPDSFMADAAKEMRGAKIYLSPEDLTEVAESFGGAQAFRRQTFGKLYFSDDRSKASQGLDEFYDEMRASNIGLPESTSPTEQVENLLSYFDKTHKEDLWVQENLTKEEAQKRSNEVTAEIAIGLVSDSDLSLVENDRGAKNVMNALRSEGAKLANRINIYDKRLLRMEATKPLKAVVSHERKTARTQALQQAKQRQVEAVAKERAAGDRRLMQQEISMIKAAGKDYNALEKKNKRLQEKIERQQNEIAHQKEMRQKGIDQRASTQLRNRIKRIRNDFVTRLLRGNENTSVPPALVQGVIDVCNFIDPTGEMTLMVRKTDIQNRPMFGSSGKPLFRTALYGEFNAEQIEAGLADGSMKYFGEAAKQKYESGKRALNDLRSAYDKLKNNPNADFSSEFSAEFSQKIGELADAIGDTPLRDMSREQLEDVADILSDIRHVLLNANKQIREGKAITNYETGTNIIDNMRDVVKKKIPTTKVGDLFRNWFTNPLRGVREMSGYAEDSELVRLFDDIDAGLRKGDFWRMTAVKLFDELRTGKNSKTYFNAVNRAYDFGLEDVDGKPLKISKMQAMQILLTYERETQNENRRHLANFILIPDVDLMRKGKYQAALDAAQTMPALTEDALEKLRKGLDTEWDKAFMDTARKVFSMSSDAVNEVSLLLKGRAIATEKAYIPYEVAGDFLARANENVTYDASIEGMGMTKSMTPNSAKPIVIRGLNAVVDNHVNDVAKYYGLAVPVRNFNKAFNMQQTAADGGSSVQKEIRNAWGGGGLKLLSQAVADVQSPRRGDTIPILSKIKSNWVSATLSMNLSVWMKQMASYPTAGSILSQRALLAGMRYFGKDLTNGMRTRVWNEIDEHTAMHWLRRQGLEGTQEIGDFAQSNGLLKRISDKAGRFSPMNWIQSMDVRTTAMLWEACKTQTRLDGFRGQNDAYWEHVTALYNKVIEDTQPMYDPLHRAEITKNKAQNFIMFQTQPIQNSGILREATMELRAAKKRYGMKSAETKQASKQFTKAVISQTVSHAVFTGMTLLAAALLHRMNPYRDDDKELKAGHIALEFTEQFAKTYFGAILPIFGNWAVSAFEYFVEGSKYDVLSEPVVDKINTTLQRLDALKKPSVNAILNAVGDLCTYLGIPFENGRKIVDGLRLHFEDIKNGKFLSFEAGVEVTKDQNAKKLVDAIMAGDTKQVDRLRDQYKSEDDYHSAIRKALKEYDDRIDDAAIARSAGDATEYYAIVDDIVADGFDKKDVLEAIKDASSTEGLLRIYGEGGNVNLLKRPSVSSDEMKKAGWSEVEPGSYATVYTSTYSDESGRRAVNVTPIVADEDGNLIKVLSPDELEAYANKLLAGKKDKLHIQIGPIFEGDDAIKTADETAEKIHVLQEKYYSNDDENAEEANTDGYGSGKTDAYFAVAGGDATDVKAVYEDLVAGGKTTKDANSIIMEGVRKAYIQGDIDKEKAKSFISEYSDKTEDDVYWLFKEWDSDGEDYDGDGEEDDFSIYGDFVEAVRTGSGVEAAVKELADHGKDGFGSALSKEFKDEYTSATGSAKDALREKLLDAYEAAYKAKGEEKSRWEIQKDVLDEWDYAAANGGSTKGYSMYADVFTAVETGSNLKAVLGEYQENGKTASAIKAAITKHFTPIYQKMSNTERASLKGYLLNAYVALGSQRDTMSKAIDKWLEKKEEEE